MASAEQAQYPAIKIFYNCPAKINPKPPIAVMAQEAYTHVRAWL
jgi:hypothetical protein